MKALKLALASVAMATAMPLAAQVQMGMEGPTFLQALRDRDDAKAMEMLTANPRIVNYRDPNGETALLTAIGRRDEQWTGYLLNQGADPNLASRDGDTPLILASRLGFDTAVEWLIGLNAKVNDKNRTGETALIAAVRGRQARAVKVLLENGADPDISDSAQGYSAREYATRDTRNRELLKLIEGAKSKKPAVGPTR